MFSPHTFLEKLQTYNTLHKVYLLLSFMMGAKIQHGNCDLIKEAPFIILLTMPFSQKVPHSNIPNVFFFDVSYIFAFKCVNIKWLRNPHDPPITVC